jgi:hypothetical protein
MRDCRHVRIYQYIQMFYVCVGLTVFFVAGFSSCELCTAVQPIVCGADEIVPDMLCTSEECLKLADKCPELATRVVDELNESLKGSMAQMEGKVSGWQAQFGSPMAEFLNEESARAQVRVLMPQKGVHCMRVTVRGFSSCQLHVSSQQTTVVMMQALVSALAEQCVCAGVNISGVCVMLPATGDMGFSMRERLLAPLAKEVCRCRLMQFPEMVSSCVPL